MAAGRAAAVHADTQELYISLSPLRNYTAIWGVLGQGGTRTRSCDGSGGGAMMEVCGSKVWIRL